MMPVLRGALMNNVGGYILNFKGWRNLTNNFQCLNRSIQNYKTSLYTISILELLYAVCIQSTGALWHLLLSSMIYEWFVARAESYWMCTVQKVIKC